jgi:hypothetical protein
MPIHVPESLFYDQTFYSKDFQKFKGEVKKKTLSF